MGGGYNKRSKLEVPGKQKLALARRSRGPGLEVLGHWPAQASTS